MVPLLPLLTGLPSDRFDTLEARATDGFVAQIPLSLVRKGAEGGATAWIAVEPPDQPWPSACVVLLLHGPLCHDPRNFSTARVAVMP